MKPLKSKLDRNTLRLAVGASAATTLGPLYFMLAKALIQVVASEIPVLRVFYLLGWIVVCTGVFSLCWYRFLRRITFQMDHKQISGETLMGKKINISWDGILHIDPIGKSGYNLVGNFQTYAIHNFFFYQNDEELLVRLAESLPNGTPMPDSLRCYTEPELPHFENVKEHRIPSRRESIGESFLLLSCSAAL